MSGVVPLVSVGVRVLGVGGYIGMSVCNDARGRRCHLLVRAGAISEQVLALVLSQGLSSSIRVWSLYFFVVSGTSMVLTISLAGVSTLVRS